MDSDEARLFRERLRSLRDSRGLSQSQLEERIGKEANYITRVETGKIGTPPLDVLASIARALGVPMSDLFFFDGLDDNPDIIRSKILEILKEADPQLLRKYYRLLLITIENR